MNHLADFDLAISALLLYCIPYIRKFSLMNYDVFTEVNFHVTLANDGNGHFMYIELNFQ